MLQIIGPTVAKLHPSFYRGILAFFPLHEKIWISCFTACSQDQCIKEIMAKIGDEISFSLGFSLDGESQGDLTWRGLPLSYFLEQGPIFAFIASLAPGLQQSPAPMIHFEREEAVDQMAALIAASHQPSPYLAFILDHSQGSGKTRIDASMFQASLTVGVSQQIKQEVRKIFLV